MNRQALISEKKTTSPAKDTTKPPALQLPASAISPLDGSLAHTYTLAHPLIILSTFFARFEALVSDPVESLLTSLAVVGILQIVYVVLCLPPTAKPAATSPKPQPQKQIRVGKSSRTKSVKGDAGAAGRTVVRDRN
jgi:GPI ethanolamine phosphate transferase 2/3 subunit F